MTSTTATITTPTACGIARRLSSTLTLYQQHCRGGERMDAYENASIPCGGVPLRGRVPADAGRRARAPGRLADGRLRARGSGLGGRRHGAAVWAEGIHDP